jgi:hypothetical protein
VLPFFSVVLLSVHSAADLVRWLGGSFAFLFGFVSWQKSKCAAKLLGKNFFKNHL